MNVLVVCEESQEVCKAFRAMVEQWEKRVDNFDINDIIDMRATV